ncbi:hypothetical protein [Variovorax sp. AFSI2.2]
MDVILFAASVIFLMTWQVVGIISLHEVRAAAAATNKETHT